MDTRFTATTTRTCVLWSINYNTIVVLSECPSPRARITRHARESWFNHSEAIFFNCCPDAYKYIGAVLDSSSRTIIGFESLSSLDLVFNVKRIFFFWIRIALSESASGLPADDSFHPARPSLKNRFRSYISSFYRRWQKIRRWNVFHRP